MVTITKDICSNIIHQVTSKPFHVTSFKLQGIEEKSGLLGEHLSLFISYTQNDEIVSDTFFVKCLPTENEQQRRCLETMGVFRKELLVYRNIIGNMKNSRRFAPICYYSDEKNSWFVLEDLKAKGYNVCESPLKVEGRIFAVLRTIAQFHSASVTFEEELSIRMNKHFPEETKETTFSFLEGHPRNSWFKTTIQTVETLIKKVVPNWKQQDTVLENLKRHIGKLPELISASRKFRNVLTHDDLWSTNIMLKDGLEKPEVLLVDFQLTRYTPPALDVLLFLYLNLQPKFLKEEIIRRYLKAYYNFFREELPYEVMSEDVFWESVEEYRVQALLEAVMYGTLIFLNQTILEKIMRDSEEFEKIMLKNRRASVCEQFETDEVYRERLEGLLGAFVDVLI